METGITNRVEHNKEERFVDGKKERRKADRQKQRDRLDGRVCQLTFFEIAREIVDR